MTEATEPLIPPRAKKRATPTFFFLRGLAIVLPPVLTLLILLWVVSAFNTYVIHPINFFVRYAIASWTNDIRSEESLIKPPPKFATLPQWQRTYRITPRLQTQFKDAARVSTDTLLNDDWESEVFVPMGPTTEPRRFVPLADYNLVFEKLKPQPLPTTPIGVYMEIVSTRYFRTSWHLSAVALLLTIVLLYFLGRFVTVRIGAWIVSRFEALLMTRVPFVGNVYSTVKQVTDFLFSERELQFNRVVAIEYPRRGIWSLAFVTGEGMLDCAAEAGEPTLTLLVPTSPMPMTGYTMMVARSQVLDVNLTIDQALQFIVSCGVLSPAHQRTTAESLQKLISQRVSDSLSSSGTTSRAL